MAVSSGPQSSPKAKINHNGASFETKKKKFFQLLDPRRHFDHKATGLSYVISFSVAVYLIIYNIDYYESTILFHLLPPLIGILVSASAIRNFKFLSKDSENPGMFAKYRTFSFSFLKENLYFQFLLGLSFFVSHPLSYTLIPTPIASFLIFVTFVLREFVPKTSYVSWEVGNKKVNERFQGWTTFINAQVKIVRWNYVFKKTLLLYLVVIIQAEYFLNESFTTQLDRAMYYLLSLDAMHNITTAFFLQTLKFKGFLSAEAFAILFNASPFIGVYLTYKLISNHHFVWPYAIATAFDLFVNLNFIYPSKLSPEWKNRCQVSCKTSCILAATAYLIYA